MPTTPAWDAFRDRLIEELASLTDGGSFVLAEPDPAPAPAPARRWYHLVAPRPEQGVGRYVMASRLGTDLLCECVSQAYADVTPEQAAVLLGLGWSDPQRQPRGATSENHVFWGNVEDLATSAEMLRAALQALGTGIPDDRWRWDRVG